ncbi:glycoside hydrolase family 2 protein [Bombardia bombarda]|uniref:Glycoside hydrolase family 2 protein n=1 Tax=Bombardia bombarda TaxID=252184 RepID=A0AA39WGR2_9PEZI|nr:glycoside hydrolase family 2 protein [Bombardia bombarda]
MFERTNEAATSLETSRERIPVNGNWRFSRTETNPDNLIYDLRPDAASLTNLQILKPWILPSANDFIADPADHHQRPSVESPGSNVSFAQPKSDDSSWESVTLPHDWAIKGPFYTAENAVIGGGMGRLPSQGVGWYRRKLSIGAADKGKTIHLEIDGAMSYAMVWVNGQLVGGWPYGYQSFRLDITAFVVQGDDNQLAVRVDNPVQSSRWYPGGGGLYRNVWLTKTEALHVGQWGTFITSRDVSDKSAVLDLVVQVENSGTQKRQVQVVTEVYTLDSATERIGDRPVAQFPRSTVSVNAGAKTSTNASLTLNSPNLWQPLPVAQNPNLYVAVTRLYSNNALTDSYTTRFGIRSLVYSGSSGLLVNGQRIPIRGVNQHHDLGSLGAAFNARAASRQLETLRSLGANAIRMSHNPPTPELLDLTDRMGFLVMDEIFDCWEKQKNANDFHLIFADWSEPDLRAFIRRDRNHPSVISWSVGNEVGEQTDGDSGAAIAKRLHDIAKQEDPTRPSTASMNVAKPNMPFPAALDTVSLNYQGEGIRDTPAYAGLPGTTTPPIYGAFHAAFPDRLLLSTETAASLSTRGAFFFPLTSETSAPSSAAGGANSTLRQVSSYEVYTTPFGASPDKVFAAQDANSPYVAGEFVWAGWDYLGEPDPHYSARSSNFGIIDLAGFKKERWWLYMARWRPEERFAHILPHWSWGADNTTGEEGREGKVTPVHVFTSADEGELWVNGESMGRLRKGEGVYRFRWDGVVYQPGEVRVETWKGGREWAEERVRTVGRKERIRLTVDRGVIKGDGVDLAFITAEVVDGRGDVMPRADDEITFEVESKGGGVGEIVATDNGDPYDFVAFPSKRRKAFAGMALAIVKSGSGVKGELTVTAEGKGLKGAKSKIRAQVKLSMIRI